MFLDSNNYILESYVERALASFDSRASFHTSYINCRCPVCGDSEKNKRKKRGYILKNNPKDPDVWVYHCHNGDCEASESISVKKWLKIYFNELYHEYIREVFQSNRDSKIKQYVPKAPIKKEEPYDESKDIKYFIPILEGKDEIFNKAISYVKSRNIEESIWSKFYVSIGGRFQGRLIIPFYNKEDIYFYQARSLIGQEPKYLNRKTDDRPIFNIFNIDRDKEVLVTEGPIDSMFVENGIAVLGVKYKDKVKEELDRLNCFYIWDNDKDGKKKSLQFLQECKYVFNWKKFLQDAKILKDVKDVNDLALLSGINKFRYEMIKEYFTNDICDTFWFK